LDGGLRDEPPAYKSGPRGDLNLDGIDGAEIVRLRGAHMDTHNRREEAVLSLPKARLVRGGRILWYRFPDEFFRNERAKTLVAVGMGLVANLPNNRHDRRIGWWKRALIGLS